MRDDERTAYHLVPEAWFREQAVEAAYLSEAFAQDGFIHLTHGIEPVLAAGNRYYRDDARPYLLLTVNLERVTAEIRYDDPARQFPHIYGAIDRALIITVQRVTRGDDGTFLSVTEQPT